MSRSYGVYIHIPFCKAKCKYCAFVSTPDLSLQKKYVQTLLREIDTCPERGARVDTVYIGGGTPSCLYDGAISKIIDEVRSVFNVNNDAEITVECNPESATERFADECLSVGVNRISMGLQSASDRVLRNIGRVHNREQFVSALNVLSRKFDNISSDIILGLPEQDISDVKNAVDIISDNCSHASVYALTVEEGTPLYKDGYIPDDERVADMYDFACERLSAIGFERYEVSNFARNGKQSRHNNKYWECLPYIGLGVAAHGYDGKLLRYKHTENISDYISSPLRNNIILDDKDRYNEYIMLRLRTERGIDLKAFRNRFGYDFLERNAQTINKLQKDGYIEVDVETVKIAPKFMFVMNGIIEDLMLD